MSVDDSISCWSSFIFPFPKYYVNNIPCTLSLCHRSIVSILMTLLSTNLTVLISILKWFITRFSALDFSVGNMEMASDYKYLTPLNRVYAGILSFWSDLFRVSIGSASDLQAKVSSYPNIILLFLGLNFCGLGKVLLRFGFSSMTSVQVLSIVI